jgi:hypothetical protein
MDKSQVLVRKKGTVKGGYEKHAINTVHCLSPSSSSPSSDDNHVHLSYYPCLCVRGRKRKGKEREGQGRVAAFVVVV